MDDEMFIMEVENHKTQILLFHDLAYPVRQAAYDMLPVRRSKQNHGTAGPRKWAVTPATLHLVWAKPLTKTAAK